METPDPESASSDDATAIEQVFERLLGDIIGGVYASGTRLPAERELARQLETSRPTLREALHRLSQWRLVEPRRGSGIVIRPYRDWSIEVLPAYIRHGKPDGDQPSVIRILVDMFAMRRTLLLEVFRITAPRVPRGGTHNARVAMARAWSARDQPSYVYEDVEMMRAFVEASRFTPGVWLLNRLAHIWTDGAGALKFVVKAPDDYVAVHTKFFDLIEAGQSEAAIATYAEYIERHDQAVTGLLEGMLKASDR